MPSVVHLSKRERVDLFKVTALEVQTGSVTVREGDGPPRTLAPGTELIDPRTPLDVERPGRVKYWVEGEPREVIVHGDAPRGDSGDSTGPYEARTLAELRKLATERGIPGRSKMDKPKLIAALRADR